MIISLQLESVQRGKQEEPFKMCDRRKMFLAAIIFTALYYKVTAESYKNLDMAPDAVDDQYSGCREEAMKKFIHSGLLRQELNQSKGFERAWSEYIKCSKPIQGGIKEHTAALEAYANEGNFIETFNKAVETKGVNVSIYENDFHFKSFHFLLMDSMKLLNPNPKCQTVFLLPEVNQMYTAQKGSRVRLGRFAKVYPSYRALLKAEADLDQILNITSCFLVDLEKNVCSSHVDMMLLSPVEVFTVEDIHEMIREGDKIKVIVLKHSKLDSSHNCYIFSR
ncbi:hypothetical protein L3Q82_019700 [Scortum barcoo]|uniref:Uncharacterized protein n=1 Tax=Scortum barcoo TaxID=214431 RepID=A0ACB8VCH5_9TELE|nr:hypothetical protein L3Q82_019700 [Scortum barcoo]